MTIERKYFVDVFEDWIVSVRALYDTVNLIQPYSYFGSITEIVNYLTELGTVSAKYPFVALVDDKGIKPKMMLDWYEVNPTIYIFTETLIAYNPQERYTNVIKPILFPIMEYLKDIIEYSESVSEANESTEPEYEIYKGNVEGQAIQDTVDCIRLSYQNLRIKNLY